MENTILKELQATEYEILRVVDRFCKKYQIDYSLYGGTLIGAVRHGGFIPWDDDIDIVMLRNQYSTFCNEWELHPIQGYYLENFETDSYTQNTHTKIRKNDTILLSDVEDESIGHHGIWIDIFVMDKISNDAQIGKNVINAGRKMILMAKANGNLPGEGLVKRVARTILKLIYPQKKRKRALIQIAEFLRKNDQDVQGRFELCDMCTLDYLKIRFSQETGAEYTKLKFQDGEYPVFSNYDDVLKVMYGDYMTPPPAEEQVCRHNPKKIQF